MANVTSLDLPEGVYSLTNTLAKDTLSSLLSIFRPYMDVAVIIALVIIAYWILRLVLLWFQNRKLRKTYKNTNLILEKLDKLEEKISKLEKNKKK